MVDVQHELDSHPDFEGPLIDGAGASEVATSGIADNLADADGRRRDTEAREPQSFAELEAIRGQAANFRYEDSHQRDLKRPPISKPLEPEVIEVGTDSIAEQRALLRGVRSSEAELAQNRRPLPQARGADMIAEANDIKARQQAERFVKAAKDKKGIGE